MRYSEVDVFTDRFMQGNPVAVVHDADGLTEEQMAAFARWTNLSETTFLLTPADPAADYRLRIFTPGGELPFAGHPTLGSARAWLEAGGTPQAPGELVQECGAGLVAVRASASSGDGGAARLALAAPPLVRSGPADEATRAQVALALGLAPESIRAAEWVDNGPGWVAVLLDSAATVLALTPDYALMDTLKVGVVGPHDAGGPADVEVRTFVPTLGVPEDPVTGSFGAGIGGWLPSTGVVGETFTIRQGTALRRDGRLYVSRDAAGTVWVAGDTVLAVTGDVAF